MDLYREITRQDITVNPDTRPGVYSRARPRKQSLLIRGLCSLCAGTLAHTEEVLCSDCESELPRNISACPACAIPVLDDGICADCLQMKRPLITRALAVFRYEYPVNVLIQDMKFRSRLDISALLGRAMARAVVENGICLPECLVPVPLHPARTAGRGFNQSLELARFVSAVIGIPVDYHLARRPVKSAAQTGSTADDRRRNVRGAFCVTNHRRGHTYRHVAIVDDVITTGSTVRELARTLLRIGVGRVDVWACARPSKLEVVRYPGFPP